jgi:hypothetical protein
VLCLLHNVRNLTVQSVQKLMRMLTRRRVSEEVQQPGLDGVVHINGREYDRRLAVENRINTRNAVCSQTTLLCLRVEKIRFRDLIVFAYVFVKMSAVPS